MTMFRRIFAMTVLGGVLAAGQAAAQNQGYSVWAQRGGFFGRGFRQVPDDYRPGRRSDPDAGHWNGVYPSNGNLGDFSHYTDPYDAGYGGHVNDDFTVTKDTAFKMPVTSTPLAVTRTATIEVRVPDPQAQVTFDGQQTATRGTQRVYATPALHAAKNYHYNVTAIWMKNGRQVKRDLQIGVNAGRRAVVDFTTPVLTATESR
jgi:uncharacterized protein (TIGR03000 family)